MTSIVLPAMSDMHLHVRQDDVMKKVCPHSAVRCCRVLVMPNTIPPITTAKEAANYKQQILKCMPGVDVLTTIKFMPDTTPKMIKEAALGEVTAVKLYPHGVTTNSNDGITAQMLRKPSQQFLDVIEMIRKTNMVLCLHGEMPGEESKDSESEFLEFVEFLAYNFPKLRVVLEHITTAQQVSTIRRLAARSKCNIAGTITAHHLILTHDDVMGDKIRPHNFCKPIPKWKIDREALRNAAMSGEPCFFFGSDSAPHSVNNKECPEGCAGVFTAPVMTECLIEIFEQYDKLGLLQFFISEIGNDYYLVDNKEVRNIKFDKTKHVVNCASSVGDVQPFRANEELQWKMSDYDYK